MRFKTVAEAFNYYRNQSVEVMEKRAQEINQAIDTDPNADVEAFNIELKGIKEAIENGELRSQALNLVSSVDMRPLEKREENDDVYGSKEYRNGFFKTMLGQKLTSAESAAYEAGIKAAEQRADAYNTSTDAVAVLPTSTLNEVVKKARTIGGLLAECRAFNMPTKIAIPVGTPSNKAAWHTEGAAVETEKATVANVTFDGYEIIKIFSISAKTRTMSVSAFESYLVDELVACVMETIADALINGTGSNQGTGLEAITWTKNTNLIQAAKGSTISYTNVIDAVALLKRGYSQGAKFAMNNATLYKTFYGMCDSNKRPIFLADPKNDSVGKILGFEVVVDDNIANDTIYFGNYSKYLGYNMPESIAIETSRESSFKKGLIDYRAMAIADTKPIVEEAFVKIDIATA